MVRLRTGRVLKNSARHLFGSTLFLIVAIPASSAASLQGTEGTAAIATQQAPPVFTPEDVLAVVGFSGAVAVAPAADRIAYVLPDMADEWNVLERRPVGWLHVHDVGGSAETIQLTRGAERSSFPAWSPDGRRLAFFIEDSSGGRLAVWDSVTGDLDRHGPTFTGSASSPPQWGSDDRIVYATPLAPGAEPERPRIEVVRSSDRLIPGDAFFARTDEAGLAMVDLATGEAKQLLGPRVLRQFSVAPGGHYLIFVEPTAETLGIVGGEVNETFLAKTDGGAPLKIGDPGQRFTWSPDGTTLVSRRRGGRVAQRIMEGVAMSGGAANEAGEQGAGVSTTMLALVAPEPYLDDVDIALGNLSWAPGASHFVTLVADASIADPEVEPRQPGMFSIARPFMDLYLVAVEDGSAVNLTADFADNVSSPVWSRDGRSIVFRAIDNETYDETIYRYTLADEELTILARGEESYGNIVATNDGAMVTIQSATTAPDMWHVDADGQRRRLTDLNPRLRTFTFSEPELFHFDNADGERLGALLYRPAGGTRDNASRSAPGLITYIYEKLTPGIHRFNARNQMLVSHGYALLMPNVKIKVGETGTSYVKSVVPAVEAVREMGVTNGKACLWGGSFGAYGTSFVITQTNIFACAISRATPPELFRNWASGRDRDSDNIESGQARMGGSPFEYMERYLAQSAFFHLDQVETPVLIMHGVKDYTILFGEGEMFFYALRRLGKEAEFVIYNEGDHSLSRHSRQDTLDVSRRMLEWFERYLQ